MRKRLPLVLVFVAVVVAVVGASAAVLLFRDDERSTTQTTTTTTWVKAGGLIGRFVITAIDPAGNSQQATFTCEAGGNTRSGYLFKRGTFDACLTAIGDATTRGYLETGKRPRADCDAIRRITHAGWRYVITGESLNTVERRYVPVYQRLTVKTKCDEALWQQMKAMLPDS